MPSHRRDDFSKPVVQALAARVGHVCSCPSCSNPTFGPHTDPEKFINLGKAAHITAAAPKGPRYDRSLTSAERKSATNGIWLCGHHADLVDKDESAHTVEQLREWKRAAEELARRETYGNPRSTLRRVIFELTDEDREFFRSLALTPDEAPEHVLPRMTAAAQSDLEGFVNSHEAVAHTIPLHLTLMDGGNGLGTSLAGVAKGITVSGAVALVAPPGTGKTTTLIQLAEAILAGGDSVAALLPLAEWASVGGTWFETLVQRNAFRSFKPQHFMQMAYEGRLVLLLDGWNELDPQSAEHAHRQLSMLRREYPQLGVVLGTRQQAYSLDALRVRVEPLSEEQQLELARKHRGNDGERLVEQAWRTAGLRELVAIPLYLRALLLGVRDDTLPDTKDAVLASFVKQHESTPERAALLRAQLFGQHAELLCDLASVANVGATTVLSQSQSFRAATEAVGRLQAEGQLGAALQPATIIDCLVNSHLLVRSGPGGSVAFQHQQFQEWYASFHVERAMLAAAEGNAASRKELRETILDRIPWEESILFACERASRRDARGSAAVAQAIVETLGIDPMLGADMIRRATPDVWTMVRDRVMTFVAKWHKPDEVDRAVRFMILSGMPDFADRLWSFVESADEQLQFEVLRLVEPFRSSVLGPDALGRLAAMPVPQRKLVASELAHRSDHDGVELVVKMAKEEQNTEVAVEILEALYFQGADRYVTEILTKANDAVWREVAERDAVRSLADAGQRARLDGMRRPALEKVENPIVRARLLLDRPPKGIDVEGQLNEVLISGGLPIDARKGGGARSRGFPSLPGGRHHRDAEPSQQRSRGAAWR